MSALLHGSFFAALAWNPGIVFAAALLFAASVYAACVLVFRFEPWRPAFAGWRWWKVTIVAGLAGNWLYLLWAGRV